MRLFKVSTYGHGFGNTGAIIQFKKWHSAERVLLQIVLCSVFTCHHIHGYHWDFEPFLSEEYADATSIGRSGKVVEFQYKYLKKGYESSAMLDEVWNKKWCKNYSKDINLTLGGEFIHSLVNVRLCSLSHPL